MTRHPSLMAYIFVDQRNTGSAAHRNRLWPSVHDVTKESCALFKFFVEVEFDPRLHGPLEIHKSSRRFGWRLLHKRGHEGGVVDKLGKNAVFVAGGIPPGFGNTGEIYVVELDVSGLALLVAGRWIEACINALNVCGQIPERARFLASRHIPPRNDWELILQAAFAPLHMYVVAGNTLDEAKL